MAFWFTLFLWVASFALSQLLTPEPDIENARPASLNDFNFPTATEGRVIPLNWGTDLVKGPNVIWYGDLKAYPITERVQTSLFNTKRVTVGHRYHVGIQFGICHGPATLKAIYVGDELVWSGTQSTDGDIEINEKNLRGTFHFYTGSKTQSKDSYLEQHQSPCPAYRGLCHGVWEHGYVGDSTSIKAWSFEIERIPTGLGTGSVVNGADCNPMEVAYEIFTDTSWGYGYSTGDIDTTNFQAQASTLYTEGNGMSFILANQKNATDVIKEIEKQIDGHFRIDAATGKWKCELIRDGYSTTGLKEADVSNVTELVDYSRSGWEGTINSVRIQYKRRANDYADGYAPAHDAANMTIQGRRVPVIFNYMGVRDDTLANKIAWREIRSNSYPFAKLRIKVNREFWDSYIGEVILFTWDFEDFSVSQIPFRITKIDGGNPEAPEITIDAVQDVFSWRAASFSDSDTSAWVIPPRQLIPFPSADQIAFEQNYAIARRDPAYNEGKIWTAGDIIGRGEIGYKIFQRNSSGTPAGTFYSAGESNGHTWTGELATGVDQDATTINVTTDMSITEVVQSATGTDIGENLTNLFLLGDELCSFTGVSEITGGLQFTGCYRGLCDTAQAEHASSEKVWFISTGGGLTDTAFNPSYNVDLKLLPYDQHGNQVAESDAGITLLQVDMDYRERKPYPPTFVEWNAQGYPTTVTIHSGVGVSVTFNRRDYRILDEDSQYNTDASTINGDFPANNNTRYRLKLYDGASLVYTGAWNAGAASLTMTFVKILRYLDGLPSTLKMSVDTIHTVSTVDYEALQEVLHEATVAASSYDDDVWMGVCDTQQISDPWTAPDTGTYGFTLGSALAGDVEARINGGTFSTIITAGNLTGNLTGVTANDIIEVRHQDSSSSDEVLLTINSPTSTEDGFAVMIFDNTYASTYGGFGRGGFGTGPFGR